MLFLIVIALIGIGLVFLAVRSRSTQLLWILVAISILGVLLVLLNLVAVLTSGLPPDEVRTVVLNFLITALASIALAWYCFRKAKQFNKEEQEALNQP